MGVALALALLAVAVGDTIEVLRRERATDPLTGLFNRRGFDECVISHLQTPGMRPVSLVVADIDHFKNINDAFGHQVGDNVLAGFGRLLLETLGQAGVCGRLGGEEFVVLMPNCSGRAAKLLQNGFGAKCAKMSSMGYVGQDCKPRHGRGSLARKHC